MAVLGLLLLASQLVVGSGRHSYEPLPCTWFLQSCGVTKSGALYCWGYNAYYQLGLGDATNRLVPTLARSNSPYASVSAGGAAACGLQGVPAGLPTLATLLPPAPPLPITPNCWGAWRCGVP